MGGVEGFKFGDNEPCVVIDVSTDGQNGNTSVRSPDCLHVRAWHDHGLHLRRVST